MAFYNGRYYAGRYYQGRYFTGDPAPSGISGAAVITEADDTVTATGTNQAVLTATAAITEADDTLSATATLSAAVKPEPFTATATTSSGASRRRRTKRFQDLEAVLMSAGGVMTATASMRPPLAVLSGRAEVSADLMSWNDDEDLAELLLLAA